MVTVRDPVLQPISIVNLRPTQITVGLREVDDKRKRLRKRPAKKIGKFLGHHMIPVIWGRRTALTSSDHHHLALALHQEGVENVLVAVVSDLSALNSDEFWVVLDHRNWVYPFDAMAIGGLLDIPKSVTDLMDDPFRSLAGELRRVGGFFKETTLFSEFLWADFLRRRIKRKLVEKDFQAAAKQALKLAKSQQAHYLPGWCGPSTD